MRQGVALFAAAALVAASLPFLREQDQSIGDLLSKAKIAVQGPGDGSEEPVGEGPPPLADIDLTYID
ncbi:MAG: penicillin-binding protein, partial [Myxococcota bacterium]